ncbi:MAG: enoyl-CoA hydratase-related protein [Chloroflexota bacterium]|nr:enoyl-CoA hydratase-related protein [Chloroflexota bacterium]
MGAIGTLTLSGSVSAEAAVEALAGFAAGGARVVVVETETDADLGTWPGERVRWLWRDYPLPVVFAFEGTLAGAEAALALGCDIRVCGEGAVIELDGESMDGLTAERARTLLGLETGDAIPTRLTAGEALEAGLVSRVGPAGSAAEVARGAAEAVAARGPIATRLAKEAVWRGLDQPLEQALRFETDLTLLLQATKDRAEGVRAFLEKRPPDFTGE